MNHYTMIKSRNRAHRVLEEHLPDLQQLLQFVLQHQLVLKRHLLQNVQSPLRKRLLEQEWQKRSGRLVRMTERRLTVADAALVVASLSWMNHLIRTFDSSGQVSLPQDVMQEIVVSAATLLRSE